MSALKNFSHYIIKKKKKLNVNPKVAVIQQKNPKHANWKLASKQYPKQHLK